MKRNNAQTKRRFYHLLILVLIAAAVIILDVLFIVTPDKKSSDTENRNLTQFPAITFHSLTSGDFETDFESYIADQFPKRDMWIRVETTVSRIIGQKESNGIYLGKDGYLIQEFTEPDAKSYQQTLNAIQTLADMKYGVTCSALIAPTAADIYSDKIPAGARSTAEDEYLDRLYTDLSAMDIQTIDVRPTLRSNADNYQLYYRTDHHWTTDCAYLAFREMSDTLKLNDTVDYSRDLISDSFSGTLTASSGFRVKETDDIYVYEPQKATDYTVYYVSENEKTASVYCTDNLNTRDQYTVFFNGNHPEVKIWTGSQSEKTLLIFKDSYANCFVPFLIPHYSKIIMVDPRYYTDDIESLMETEEVTDILFLYNADTLATDRNLVQLTAE